MSPAIKATTGFSVPLSYKIEQIEKLNVNSTETTFLKKKNIDQKHVERYDMIVKVIVSP